MKYIWSYKLFESSNEEMDLLKDILISDLEDLESEFSLSNEEGFNFATSITEKDTITLTIPIQGKIFYDNKKYQEFRWNSKFEPLIEDEIKLKYNKIVDLLNRKMSMLSEVSNNIKYLYYFRDLITFSVDELMDFDDLKYVANQFCEKKNIIIRNNDVMRYLETIVISFKY